MTIDRAALRRLITDELESPVSQEIIALSDRIRSGRRGIVAVLLYGAGLWKGPENDTVFDFYVLTDNYRAFDARRLHAVFGRLLPPNVYYLEAEDLRCKYAVIRIDQFEKATAGRNFHTQIWARFAQPCRLVYARDQSARDAVAAMLAEAVITFHAQTLPLLAPDERRNPRSVWIRGLERTYRNEWRSESGTRVEDIYAASKNALDARSELVLAESRPAAGVKTRGYRRVLSKAIYFLQLMKAAFTFDGGVEYALWKIERQSGVKLHASEFQKRHPLISAWPLVWKAWRSGGLH